MKMWLAPAEIAELALPDMPTTRENVVRLATRESWHRFASLARPRQGRGGGTEYHVQLLPVEARAAYIARMGGAELAEAAACAMQAAPDIAPGMSSAAALQRDARLAIIGAYRAFARTCDLSATTAVIYFVDLYNMGRVDAAAWVRGAVSKLSQRTLQSWLAKARDGAVDSLGVDRGAARRGTGLLESALDGQVKAKVLALIAHNPHLSAHHLREVLIDQFGELIPHRGKTVPFPCVRALQGCLKRWKTECADELLAITNPDAFKSRIRVTGSRAHLVARLNELWEIDASPADMLTTDGRHALYVCIDVWSRRMIITVTKTPRAEAVALLMRKALLAWGVPELVKTDNGSDFTARATRRLFAALGIETETAAPFSPEQKGVVERAIGTVQRDFIATLPGFVGHSVADRKVIESRKAFSNRLGQDNARAFGIDMTAAELQSYADAWANDSYAHRMHGGIGETPFARAASWSQPVRRFEDEAALGVLLAPAVGGDGTRTVGKQGLRLDGAHYIAPGLLPGRRVLVRLDPADLGRVWCFEPDGETYLGVAVCPELRGTDRAAAVAEAQAMQRRMMTERTAEIRQDMRKIKPRDAADALARRAALNAGKLVELPRRATSISTPALDAASEAAGQRTAPAAPLPAPQHAALTAQIEQDIAAGHIRPAAKVQPLRNAPTAQQLYRKAMGLDAVLAAGGTISTEDALWLGAYRASPAYRSMDALFKDFGEAALR